MPRSYGVNCWKYTIAKLNPCLTVITIIFQLVGLEVRTTQGELLGNISEILTAPANDNYVVSRDKEQILIPAVEDIVKSVDLDKGCVVIEPIDGLLTLNKKTGS